MGKRRGDEKRGEGKRSRGREGREGRVKWTKREGRGQEVHEEREMKAEQIRSERRTRIHQLPLPVRTPYVHQDTHTLYCALIFLYSGLSGILATRSL